MNLGAVMNRQIYTDLFFDRLPMIDEIMSENYDAPSQTYDKVFTIRDSSRAFEEITGLTGFGLFSEFGEGEKVDYDSRLQGYDKRFVHKSYGKGYQITKQMMDDDFDGALADSAPALARAATNSIETLIWSVFNNGFGSELTPDGVSLFNDSHQLVGGGTFDNLINGDLSQENIEAAINIFGSMVDDRGLLIDVNPDNLVIPFELQWLASELLQSVGRSDTANNAINAIHESRIGIKTIVSKYLTSSSRWFMGVNPGKHRIMVYWREQPTVDHTLDFETGNMKSKMTYRLSTGAADWKGWVGGSSS
jgi:phage major head subunit gpT-like protein